MYIDSKRRILSEFTKKKMKSVHLIVVFLYCSTMKSGQNWCTGENRYVYPSVYKVIDSFSQHAVFLVSPGEQVFDELEGDFCANSLACYTLFVALGK